MEYKETIICAHCGKEFVGWKRKQRKYCSKECFLAAKRNRVTLVCEFCGKPFETAAYFKDTAQYCSKSCRAKAQWGRGTFKVLSGEDHPRYEGPVTVECWTCGKQFDISRAYYNMAQKREQARFYCSKECRSLGRSQRYRLNDNPNWHNGSSFEPYGEQFDTKLRNAIRKRDGFRCQLCGRTQKENLALFGRKLSVHHIDYSKDNHSPNNLITLCHTCHSETNGNREHYQKILKEMLCPIQTPT